MSALLVAWALVASGFSWVAWWRLRRALPTPARSSWPAVLLLRPVESPTASELEAVAAPFDYRGPLEQRVLSPTALDVPGWVHSDPAQRNRKVGHLLGALSAPRPSDAIVLAVDADVRVDGALVRALVDEVLRGAALAWAAPVPVRAEGAWARAQRGLLARTHHSFLALAAMPAGAPTVCGKAIALDARACALLPLLAGCIGEDLELAVLLRARGLPVRQAATVAPIFIPREGRPTLARFTRWMQVLRAHRPGLAPTVPLLFAPAPLLLPLLAVFAPTFVPVLVLSRLLLAVRLGRVSGAGGSAWEWLLGEALLLGAFAAALGKRTVAWRGRRFRVLPGGQLEPA